MADRLTDLRLDVDPGSATERIPVPREERPFTIAILGDFTGRDRRAGAGDGLSARRPVRFDRDDVDAALARLAPELRITSQEGGPVLELAFASMDDFHPDQLYATAPIFRSLRELRARLADPSTFRAAASELTAHAEPPAPPPAPISPGSLLEQIVAGTEPAEASPPPPPREGGADLHAYIRRIVARHRVPAPDPRQADLLAQVDAAIGEQMRGLLHHPAFQALESAWRSVHLLAHRVETSSMLQLHLIDASREELRADLAPDRDLRRSALYRLLAEDSVEAAGGTPWSLLVGNYAFGPEVEDLVLLARLAELGRAAGAPWLCAAEPELVGAPSAAAAADAGSWRPPEPVWDEIRAYPAASFVGLVYPRLLLRLPYGAGSEPCERLHFEEMASPPRHEHYLWGNPAVAAALLVARAFEEAGWEMRLGSALEIDGLPLHLVRDHGEVSAQACAEFPMAERVAEKLLDAGVMPLASLKGSDAVRLVQFRSIASPPAPLAGRWRSFA